MNHQKHSLQAMRLQQQNRRLQKAIDQYMEEIQHFKHINSQHEKQIQSLLKFNERLLSIIEDEVNNNQNALKQKSLQPISQVTQNDSENMEQMMQSLQKTRKKLAARSQKGANPYMSNHQHRISNTTQNNKVYQYMNEVKDLQRSQRFISNDRQHSEFGNKSSFSKKRQKKIHNKMEQSAKNDFEQEPSLDLQRVQTQTKPFQQDHPSNSNFAEQIKKNAEEYKMIEEKVTTNIQKEIEEMRKMKCINEGMLDDKINRLNKLSKEMTYNPEKKFAQLQNKLKLSPHVAAMVQKAMVKK